MLGAALDPAGPRIDYYAHHPQKDDAGYLQCIVETCRAALRELPSYASVAEPMRRAAARMVSYQSLNLNEAQGGHAELARWACAPDAGEYRSEMVGDGGLRGLLARCLHADRGWPPDSAVGAEEAIAIEQAYFPWIGSLHLLLDSLVDRQEDRGGRSTQPARPITPRRRRLLRAWA